MPFLLQSVRAVALYAAILAGFWATDQAARRLTGAAATPPSPLGVAFFGTCEPACDGLFLPSLQKADALGYFDKSALRQDLTRTDLAVGVLNDWSQIAQINFLSNAAEMRDTIQRDHKDKTATVLTLTLAGGKQLELVLYTIPSPQLTPAEMDCVTTDLTAHIAGLRPETAWTLDRTTCP